MKSGEVPPEEPAMESRAQGVVVPIPKLPCIVEAVVVPVTMSEPLTVVISVMESPNVVLPSTLKVEALVVESVTEPTEVRLLTKTSPSASTRNFTEPFTAAAMRLLSPTALAGLTTKEALKRFEFAAPMVHGEKVCASVGARVARSPPEKVEVAEVEVAEKDGADISP